MKSSLAWSNRLSTCQRGLHRFDRQTETFTRVVLDAAAFKQAALGSGLADGCLMVSILHEDRAGAFWIGIFAEGLARLDRATGTLTAYTHDPDDPHSLGINNVWSLFEDRQGTIWIGALGGSLTRMASASRFRYAVHDPDDPASLSHNDITALFEDRSGTLWVGTSNGLNRRDETTGAFTQYLPGDEIKDIYEDGSGQLWLATETSGLLRFDRTTGEATRCLPGLHGGP